MHSLYRNRNSDIYVRFHQDGSIRETPSYAENPGAKPPSPHPFGLFSGVWRAISKVGLNTSRMASLNATVISRGGTLPVSTLGDLGVCTNTWMQQGERDTERGRERSDFSVNHSALMSHILHEHFLVRLTR